MKKENAMVGAAEWLQDVYAVVEDNAKDHIAGEKLVGDARKEIRAIVAEKVKLLEEGKLQPLDKPTYQEAIKHLIFLLVGKTNDARSIKTARQTITAGSRWNFGALNPSAKRRAQIAGSKANKMRKANKTHGAKVKSSVHAAIAKAIADALKRGVTHVQLLDAIKTLPASK